MHAPTPTLVSFDAALAHIRTVPRLAQPPEDIVLASAWHRVPATDVLACHAMPHADNSALDGYAVRAADTEAASPAHPVRLPLSATVASASRLPEGRPLVHAPGTATRIFTGGWLPGGADAMVGQERVTREGGMALFTRPVPVGHNIRRAGEEFQPGTVLLPAGRRLTPGAVALAAAGGHGRLACFPRPRVTILVTGDEIVPPGQPLAPGETHNSNGPLLAAYLASEGLAAHWDTVPDTLEAVTAALRRAVTEADIVLTTGGASVGERDYLRAAAPAAGFHEIFWGIAQKPGKPMGLLGHPGGTVWLALPGNPGAVASATLTLMPALLDAREGVVHTRPGFLTGALAGPVMPDPARETWLRARASAGADGRLLLHPLGFQTSHMLRSAAADDAPWLARLPAGEKTPRSGHGGRVSGLAPRAGPTILTRFSPPRRA